MLNGTEWAALGVAATLLAGYIAHSVGWIQVGLMREAHSLNTKRATPKINSRVSVSPFHPANRPDVTRYTIHTKIYNDGDLVARHLEGQWKLTASHGINERSEIIRADSLPAFLPLELNYEIVGNIQPEVILHVDIKLGYFGLDDKPECYQTTWDYDFQHKSMLQRK